MFTTQQSRVGEDMVGGRGKLKILLNWPMIKCTGAINMGYCQYSIPKEILARVSIETRKLFLLMMTEQPGVSGKANKKNNPI